MNPDLIKLLQTLEPAALQVLQTVVENLYDHVEHAQVTHPANTPAPAPAEAATVEPARRF